MRQLACQEAQAKLLFARYYGPQDTFRFLSVDPAAASVTFQQPQTWNRYAYALNSPVVLVDPDGLCSAPSEGEGICVEAFISTDRIETPGPNLGHGDGRSFAADNPDLTSRIEVKIGLTTDGPTEPEVRAGESRVSGLPDLPGFASAEIVGGATEANGDLTFTLTAEAQNGYSIVPGALDAAGQSVAGSLASAMIPQGSIRFDVNYRVTPDGAVSVDGGARTAYPSFGNYGYRGGQPYTLHEIPETTPAALQAPMVPIPPSDPR